MSRLTGRALLVAALLAPGWAGEARAAAGACDLLVSPPVKFEPPALGTYPTKFVPGFATSLDLYSAGASRRLIVRQNYGYSIFDLTNPAVPLVVGLQDIESTFPQDGDGFETVVTVAAAADGSRALASYKQTPHGTLLLKPFGNQFTFGGEFSPGRAGSLVVEEISGRYLAWALDSAGLYVADVTSFVSAPNNTKPNSVSRETVPGAPGGSSLLRAGRFLVYGSTAGNVVVVDARNPGPVGSIVSGLSLTSLAPQAFGLPASQLVASVAASLHPVDGRLLVFLESRDPSGSITTGYGLAASVDGHAFTSPHEPFLPPAPWGGGSPPGVATAIATGDDVLFLVFTRDAAGLYKLITTSAADFGVDRTPAAVYDPAAFAGSFPQPVFLRGFAQGADIWLYLLTRQAGFVVRLSNPVSTPVASANGPLCTGQTLALSASAIPGAAFAWKGPNGFTSSAQSPVIAPAGPEASGLYTVTATIGGCVSLAGSVWVDVGPPLPAPTNGGPACVGQALRLFAVGIPGASYAWTGPSGFTSTLQNPVIASASPANAGLYSVTATVGLCSSSGSTSVPVLPESDPPIVTPPAGLRLTQSACVSGAPVVTAPTLEARSADQGQALQAFLAGGSAIDSCSDVVRLAPQLGGHDVETATVFAAGANAVTFRFEDLAGHLGTAAASLTVDRQGDLDLDGDVDVIDNLLAQAAVVGNAKPLVPPFLAPALAADTDGDADLDVFDVVRHAAFIVGNASCLLP